MQVSPSGHNTNVIYYCKCTSVALVKPTAIELSILYYILLYTTAITAESACIHLAHRLRFTSSLHANCKPCLFLFLILQLKEKKIKLDDVKVCCNHYNTQRTL